MKYFELPFFPKAVCRSSLDRTIQQEESREVKRYKVDQRAVTKCAFRYQTAMDLQSRTTYQREEYLAKETGNGFTVVPKESVMC